MILIRKFMDGVMLSDGKWLSEYRERCYTFYDSSCHAFRSSYFSDILPIYKHTFTNFSIMYTNKGYGLVLTEKLPIIDEVNLWFDTAKDLIEHFCDVEKLCDSQ